MATLKSHCMDPAQEAAYQRWLAGISSPKQTVEQMLAEGGVEVSTVKEGEFVDENDIQFRDVPPTYDQALTQAAVRSAVLSDETIFTYGGVQYLCWWDNDILFHGEMPC